MNIHKGQSTVEFAFVFPIFIAIIFVMLLGTIILLNYVQYNNLARVIAREVALASETERPNIINKYNNIQRSTGFYVANISISTDSEDSIAEINFSRNDARLPKIASGKEIFPKNLKTIVYRMKLE